MKTFHSNYQAKFLSLYEYHETFNNNVQLIYHCGILIRSDTDTYKVAMENLGYDIDQATPYWVK